MLDYILMLLLAFTSMVVIGLLGHTSAAVDFNGVWIIAAACAPTMVMTLYLAYWQWKISRLLERLVYLLTGEQPTREEFRAVIQALVQIARGRK